MRWIALVLALATCGCGASYTAPSARVRVELGSATEREHAATSIQGKLGELGFSLQAQYADWPEEMLRGLPADMKSRAARTTVFWRHTGGKDFHGEIELLGESQSASPAFELTLSELRPGGFSPEGLLLYADLTKFLLDNDYNVSVVTPPPPTDDREYFRVQTINFFAIAAWWLVAWLCYAAALGGLTNLVLRKARVNVTARRIVFAGVGVLLATPMPAPTMFITIAVPNLLFVLEGNAAYARFADEFGLPMLIPPFVASLALSALVAARFIRGTESRAKAAEV